MPGEPQTQTPAQAREIISTELREGISKEVQSLDPSLQRLNRVDVLARRPDETLTELSPNEVIYFSAIEAMNETGIIDTPTVVNFFNRLRINRMAMNRKRVDEFLKGLNNQPQNIYPALGAPGSFPLEEKKSFVDRLMFWRPNQ